MIPQVVDHCALLVSEKLRLFELLEQNLEVFLDRLVLRLIAVLLAALSKLLSELSILLLFHKKVFPQVVSFQRGVFVFGQGVST